MPIRMNPAHDLANPPGCIPGPPTKWHIDTSTGRDILMYEQCSVIEGEQARFVMALIAGVGERNNGIRPAGGEQE